MTLLGLVLPDFKVGIPQHTWLGELDYEEVFVEFEGPTLFSASSLTGQLYLAEWAAQGESVDHWLYVPLSRRRLDMVRSGAWPVRRAFIEPEGKVFEVVLPFDGAQDDQLREISIDDLPESWLPGESFQLDLPTATLQPAVDGNELARRARQEGRARFRIELDLPEVFRTEAATRRVGALLSTTQGVFDNLGLVELEPDPPQRGRIAQDVLNKTETEVVELAAASFVIELAATDGDDLFGDSPIASVMARVVNLMAVDIDPEELVTSLAELRPRGAKSFRTFVTDLANFGGSVRLGVANAARSYNEVALSADQLQNLKGLLNVVVPDDVALLRGRMRLFRADVQRKQFGLRDLRSDQVFEGRVTDRALTQLDHATINQVYDVVLTELVSFSQAVGEKKPTYTLDQLTGSSTEVPIDIERTTSQEQPE